MVVAFSSLARIWGECSTIRSPSALFKLFILFFYSSLSGDSLTHTNSTLYARNSPQWLSELRRLWQSAPDGLRVISFPNRLPRIKC